MSDLHDSVSEVLTACQTGEVSFREQRLTDEHVILICDFIIHNPRDIFVLDLSGNHVTSVGTAALCRVLQHAACVVQELNLDNNPLKDEGAISLADGITENKFLQKLHINHCQITDIGAKFVVSSLLRNYSLHSLDVVGNNLSETSLQGIMLALAKTTGNRRQYGPVLCNEDLIRPCLLQASKRLGGAAYPRACIHADTVTLLEVQTSITASTVHNNGHVNATLTQNLIDLSFPVTTTTTIGTGSSGTEAVTTKQRKPASVGLQHPKSTVHCSRGGDWVDSGTTTGSSKGQHYQQQNKSKYCCWRPTGKVTTTTTTATSRIHDTTTELIGLQKTSTDHINKIVTRLHHGPTKRKQSRVELRMQAKAEIEAQSLQQRKQPKIKVLSGDKLQNFYKRHIDKYMKKHQQEKKKEECNIQKCLQRQHTLGGQSRRVQDWPITVEEELFAKRHIDKPKKQNKIVMDKLFERYLAPTPQPQKEKHKLTSVEDEVGLVQRLYTKAVAQREKEMKCAHLRAEGKIPASMPWYARHTLVERGDIN